jgi:cytochrome c peroxidase
VRSPNGHEAVSRQPLRGLLQHPPYSHDGSAPDLRAVVDHYDRLFGLQLTPAQKADLIEYLKSI